VLILYVSDCLAKLGSARTVPTQIEASKLLNTLSVDTFPIPGDANFPLNSHYASAQSRADAGQFTAHLNPYCSADRIISRLSSPIPDTNTSRTGRTTCRKALCRWNRKTQQMVDVFPEETLHEQKSGLIDLHRRECIISNPNAKMTRWNFKQRLPVYSFLPSLLVRVLPPIPDLGHISVHP